MTIEEKLKAAEIISNCHLSEALPYVMDILNVGIITKVEKSTVEVNAPENVDFKINRRKSPKTPVEKCSRIKELMEEKKVTEADLEQKCHTSRSMINRYKHGKTVPCDWRYEEIIRVLEAW